MLNYTNVELELLMKGEHTTKNDALELLFEREHTTKS
jgi:hypothetical protein